MNERMKTWIKDKKKRGLASTMARADIPRINASQSRHWSSKQSKERVKKFDKKEKFTKHEVNVMVQIQV